MLHRDMNVCVCLSGGADSSVLLHVLYTLREELSIHLSACHFNHGIRREEADRDEAFCKALCEGYEIPFYTKKEDLPALQPESGLSMEELARQRRYAWFEELGKTHGIHRFATAHHKSDQAETLLFHAIRGTTVAGLAGIPAQRDSFIRPFLDVSKIEILEYAKAQRLSFVEDSTNGSQAYTRNYIRHTVLPAMERLNPSVTEALCRLSGYAREDDSFLESMLPPFAERQDGTYLPLPLLRRTVIRNHRNLTGNGLCYQHLDTIVNAVQKREKTRITLPEGYECITENGMFSFRKKEDLPICSLPRGELNTSSASLLEGRVLVLCGKEDSIEEELQKSKFVYNLSTEIPLSSKGIYGMIRYRSRLPGDRLRLRGVNRSLKKLMSEASVPVAVREMVPVLYDDQGIFAVPFVGVADRVFSHGEGDLRIRIYIAENGV
ncbi:MAG: tRNA lysidine(34) synthetase TilS [Clostridia bacterium]|nr:tRNA lysidine(34) synthetase TilS [Clostridia bacterium]